MAARKQLFVLIADSHPDAVRDRLVSLGHTHFELKKDTWFVLFAGTATEAAEELGVRTDSVSTGVVVTAGNVGGRANPDLWEWIKVNRPANE